MLRWLEGAIARVGGSRQAHFAADTPIGRVVVKPVYPGPKGYGPGPRAWRAKFPDGMEIERATARDCMDQVEAIVALRLARHPINS